MAQPTGRPITDNERDDKWFIEFPSEMIECRSVVIVNMCDYSKREKCANVHVL